MFRGELVNPTERRAALHTALRNFSGEPVLVDGRDVMPEIAAERAKMLAFAADVREGRVRGALGQPMTDVVNIGIGGSDLGPAMATRALAPFAPANLRAPFRLQRRRRRHRRHAARPRSRAHAVHRLLEDLHDAGDDDQRAHARAPGSSDALGEGAVGDHFAAVSTRLDKVAEFGIEPTACSASGTGSAGAIRSGRASACRSPSPSAPSIIWSSCTAATTSTGISATAPIDDNIPMLMGLLGVWNRNVLGHASQAVIPYDQRLARFPAYLQQLQMESNGKGVRLDGAPRRRRDRRRSIWGEPGTNGQHAFFQLLHQGTEIVPVDFLVAAEPTDADRASPRSARRQLLRAGRGADARAHDAPRPRRSRRARARRADEADAPRAAQDVFRQPAVLDLALRAARRRARSGG